MAKFIHAMIRVKDLEKSEKFYSDIFDLKRSHFLDFDDFSLSYLRNKENDMELELTYNKGREEPYTHGTGYGHVAFSVEDLQGFYDKVKNLGYEPTDIKEFNVDGKKLAKFFFVLDPDGYKIEVLERYGHYI
ncbi:VOC family protein [Acinetobacter modestus]|uniref:VOC family protein n=1 Tax=Acinetobacter modestus TaxID=1776740 RepID=UPI0032099E6C